MRSTKHRKWPSDLRSSDRARQQRKTAKKSRTYDDGQYDAYQPRLEDDREVLLDEPHRPTHQSEAAYEDVEDVLRQSLPFEVYHLAFQALLLLLKLLIVYLLLFVALQITGKRKFPGS